MIVYINSGLIKQLYIDMYIYMNKLLCNHVNICCDSSNSIDLSGNESFSVFAFTQHDIKKMMEGLCQKSMFPDFPSIRRIQRVSQCISVAPQMLHLK